MSQKQGQESHRSYMDGVRVKISEKYKPPPRINLAMTYSQRISTNQQLHESLPRYDFTLETSVKDKMREWGAARNLIVLNRKEQIQKIREQYDKVKKEQELKEEQAKEIAAGNELNESNANANLEPIKQGNYTSTSEGVLIPMQVNTIRHYTNILTPIPLTNQSYTCKPTDKSPFNISDFEADTSSPFDNMELKTLNDMEELALVLQNDDKKKKQSTTYEVTNNMQTYSGYSSQDQSQINQYQQYMHQPVTNHASNSLYSTTNGYYYNSDTLHPNLNASYNYSPVKTEYSSSFDAQTPQMTNVDDINKMPPFRSVPDIMKALQTELNTTHIDDSKHLIPNDNFKKSETSRSPNKDIYPNDKNMVDNLDNPYELLSKNLQDVCNVISSMGFPLARVARACKHIGNDHKKVVEHLLALSELLALGFSETKVSSALLQCNNDRDKALEILIL